MENLINNPEDEKFKKIRVQNKAFQTRIVPLVGGVEYLELVGYTLITDEGNSRNMELKCAFCEHFHVR